MNRKELMAFEKDIFDSYEKAQIRAPVHLCGGNEKQLIEIFKKIKKDDWIFSTHRSHYHALLKSNDPEWVREEIFAQRSSHINSKKYKIFTSAIVGGNIAPALGVAMAIKRKKGKERVWCFIGDMAAETGIFHECYTSTIHNAFPLTFVIEDNGWSVYTPTRKAWFINGSSGRTNTKMQLTRGNFPLHIIRYKYKRIYPHYGIGKFITF